MGIYANYVLPRIINQACGLKATHPLRQRVCDGLSGQVVEIGFGSGHNVPFYPAEVSAVAAVEPVDLGWRLAGKRVAASDVSITRAGLDGQTLPFGDGTFDAALTTFSLCTIPDVGSALLELRRVLKSGGTLHFLEHGRAFEDRVRRHQRRLEPMQKRLFGGCHLTRPIVELITEAGFQITDVENFYEKGAPKSMGADSLGIAVAP
jgi:ubiquinone/menaquinone biosynthesis C-methylase UbiE